MDRQIVYPGSIPLDTDLLNIQRNMLLGLGGLAQCVLGSSLVASGLVCTPSASGYGVSIGPGSISGAATSDAMPFGSLGGDPTVTVKTWVNRATTDLQIAYSGDSASVTCWLVQAELQDVDAGPIALPYWNAANPAVPFSGPGNTGAAQNTKRLSNLALSVKSSGPLPLGSFAPPPADAGWIGLYGVTARAGRSSIDPADIQMTWDAPFLPFQLPQLTPGFSRQEIIPSSRGWQVPHGVRHLRVRLVGGGGGGGGGGATFGGGGGGAGGYAEGIIPVTPGDIHAAVVGLGGRGGDSGVTGGSGQATSFDSFVAAGGGSGGGSENPDSRGGESGAGLAGQLLQPGAYGSDGPSIAGVPAGHGGTSAFGGGGRSANGGGPQANGRVAGSGGGGAYGSPSTGGIGADGIIIIEY